MRKFTLRMIDGKELTCYEWTKVTEPKAILQLVHGSAEHLLRYEHFAEKMNAAGIIVVGDDHRGHGRTANIKEKELGFFAKKNGWDKLIDDEKMLNDYIHKMWPGKPVFMLGHSMGSFMVRTYAIKYSETIDGLLIMGTAENPPLTILIGKMVAKLGQFFSGAKTPAKFIWRLSYKPLNKKYQKKTNANGNEWLTRDPKVQVEFKNDPLSGQIFTNSAFKDMFTGLNFIRKPKNIKLMRKDLPIFILSGGDDPVGNYGKYPKMVNAKFKSLGYHPVLKIYTGLRHEILNEPEKEVVEKDIINFIVKNLE